jgi:hypothetical protein
MVSQHAPPTPGNQELSPPVLSSGGSGHARRQACAHLDADAGSLYRGRLRAHPAMKLIDPDLVAILALVSVGISYAAGLPVR